MKFLIATTLMCLSLVGHSQAGSLRGLAVPVPHQTYGVPVLDNEIHIEETQPIVEERDTVSIDTEAHEEPIISQPSIEYGAPGVTNGIETVYFVDSLPLVNSHVSFGTPSETYGPPAETYGPPAETYRPPAEPTTPKPDLPYLQPGLPSLPAAPVIPVVPKISEERVEVSNEYLPPFGETPSFVEVYVPTIDEAPLVVPEGKPSEVYGPPATVEVQLPTIHEIPALPEAPATVAPAAVTAEPSGQYIYEVYGPPATVEVELPTIHEIPALPKAPATDAPAAATSEPSGQYFYEPPTVGFPTPISHIPELPLQPTKAIPSEVYGPPAHEEHKPSELYGAANVHVHIPELPAATITTFAAENTRPSEAYGLPAPSLPVTDVKTVPVHATGQYFYEPPAVAFPTPESVQPIAPEIKVEAPRQYFYEVPANGFPTPVTLPVGHGIVSHSGFVQNSAITSSSSSSLLQVNKYAVPLTIQPHADSVAIEELKPIGPGFSIHSVTGNSENTSTGSYNQVAVVNHLLPQLSTYGTIVGHHQPVAYSGPVAVPHGAYGVANF